MSNRLICAKCGAKINAQDRAINRLHGNKKDFMCMKCLAKQLGYTQEYLVEQALPIIRNRPCLWD